MYKQVQTYNSKTDEWTITEFKTKEEFVEFVRSKFIKPGDHKLHSTHNWRKTATYFQKHGVYSHFTPKSADFIKFWNTEKDRCRNGVIFDEFYLTRHYYFWINFLPINDKRERKLDFPKIFDAQYYMFLYFLRCELEFKYSVVLKKRQFGSTYQHLAVLLNEVWFEKSIINKIGASDEKYIESDWQMLDEYRNFLNKHTAWTRPFTPSKKFDWQQRILVTQGDKQFYKGNNSSLKALNFKTNPTKGVGGATTKFYYEEAGITKTMKKTFEYMDPALKFGAETTGMFMAAGSVGELDECEDLKDMVLRPSSFNVLSVPNTFNPDAEYTEISFFVPEYWSMMPYIDRDGNSIMHSPTEEEKQYLKSQGAEKWDIGAVEWCNEEREKYKNEKNAEEYRMYISQHPFNIEEAFAYRKDAIFPQAKILAQQEVNRLKKNPMVVDLEYTKDGGIKPVPSDKVPIFRFPLLEKDSKEGAIEVWEPPVDQPPMFMYFAGVDTLAVDKSTTSASLFSIYIFKNLTETTDKNGNLKVDGYKMVACYTGRYDDLNKTNEIAEKLIVWYNALAAVENNVMSFINHMQARSLQRYLATKNQLSFVSELNTNQNVYATWGFKMNPTIRTYFIDVINEYLQEELDVIKFTTAEGVEKTVKTIYGVSRIPDNLILEELKQYHDKLNVDRFVAFGAGLALMKSFKKYNIGVSKITEEPEEAPKQMDLLSEVKRSFFIDRSLLYANQEQQTKRSYFKNYN